MSKLDDLPEPPGYDDRKALLDVWYGSGGTVPADVDLHAIYPALIAVARWGWDRATERDDSGMAGSERSEPVV